MLSQTVAEGHAWNDIWSKELICWRSRFTWIPAMRQLQSLQGGSAQVRELPCDRGGRPLVTFSFWIDLEVRNMRKIKSLEIFVFASQCGIGIGLAVATVSFTVFRLPLGEFRGSISLAAVILFIYFYCIALYRTFLHFFPLRPGEVDENSSQQFVYHVYVLFYLLLFYPVIRSGLLPTPAMRMFYLALGTRLGDNTYSQGIIHDPPFIQIGSDSVVGQSALLIPHVIEGNRLAHFPITIGNRVTIGAGSIVLSDVTIGDDAVIAAGAVVPKGSRVAPGETWGGVPARRLNKQH